MQRQFMLEYWVDDDWYVGKLKEEPGVFSQGETLAELEDNIKDAYALVMADEGTSHMQALSPKRSRWMSREAW
jgi:predicted RNase H-like HicB family nuclease